jgi:hypothetical protein
LFVGDEEDEERVLKHLSTESATKRKRSDVDEFEVKTQGKLTLRESSVSTVKLLVKFRLRLVNDFSFDDQLIHRGR